MMLAIWLIRASVALTMVLFGVNQMINPKAWFHYVPEFLHRMSPVSPETQMRLHAVGNIAFGLFLVAGSFHPLLAAWVAFIWWITIYPLLLK